MKGTSLGSLSQHRLSITFRSAEAVHCTQALTQQHSDQKANPNDSDNDDF